MRMSNDFDHRFYLSYYPDLFEKGFYTRSHAFKHWKNYGRKEGRIGSLIDKKYLHNKDVLRNEVISLSNASAAKTNPFVNIISRTNNRKQLFSRNREQLTNQKYHYWRQIVSVQNKTSLSYVKKAGLNQLDIVCVKRESENPYFFNLFINHLLDKVNEGWIIFLDDDDLLVSENSLSIIAGQLMDEDCIYIWKTWFPDKIIPSSTDPYVIEEGDIASCSYAFHSKHKSIAEWDDKRAADYRCFKNLRKELKPVFFDKILTRISYPGHDYPKVKDCKRIVMWLNYNIQKRVKVLSGDIPKGFDWHLYTQYPDLRKNGITSKKKAWNHWINNGKLESRYCTKFSFDSIKIPPKRESYTPKKNKILYLIDSSIVNNTSGYTIKSHHSISLIEKAGYEVLPVSRENFHNNSNIEQDYNETKYYQLNIPENNLGINNDYLQAYFEKLLAFCEKTKPAIIHANSNYLNGIIGANVAKVLGIPSIYEVRGLWELSAEANDPTYQNTYFYKLSYLKEIQACKMVTKVFVINPGIKKELVNRKVPKEKINVIPPFVLDKNAIIFNDSSKEDLIDSGNTDLLRIGYFGDLSSYEGIQDLIEVADLLVKTGITNFNFQIIGSGRLYTFLKNKIHQKQLDNYVSISGAVNYENITGYYNQIDLLCIPRLNYKVCNTVLPIKLIEALSKSKCVLVSDLEPLTDIVKDGINGFIYRRGDMTELYNKLKVLIKNPDLVLKINKKAPPDTQESFILFIQYQYSDSVKIMK